MAHDTRDQGHMEFHERLKGLNKVEQVELCKQTIEALSTNLRHMHKLRQTLEAENKYKEEECKAIEFEMKADKDRHECEIELIQRDIEATKENILHDEEKSNIQIEQLKFAKTAHDDLLNEIEVLKKEEEEIEDKINLEEQKHAELLYKYRLETVAIERDIEDRYRKKLTVADNGMMQLCFDALPETSRQAAITNVSLRTEMSTQVKGRERFQEKVTRQKAEVEQLASEINVLTQAEKDGILAVVELKKAIRDKTSQLCDLDHTVKNLEDTSISYRKSAHSKSSSNGIKINKNSKKKKQQKRLNSGDNALVPNRGSQSVQILVIEQVEEKEDDESSYFEIQSPQRSDVESGKQELAGNSFQEKQSRKVDNKDQDLKAEPSSSESRHRGISVSERKDSDVFLNQYDVEEKNNNDDTQDIYIENILENEERQQLEVELKKWEIRLEEAKNVLENTPETLEGVLENYYKKLISTQHIKVSNSVVSSSSSMDLAQSNLNSLSQKKVPLKVFEERNLIAEWRLEDDMVDLMQTPPFTPDGDDNEKKIIASSISSSHRSLGMHKTNIKQNSTRRERSGRGRRSSISSVTSEKTLEQEDEELSVELSVEFLEERLRKRSQILDKMNNNDSVKRKGENSLPIKKEKKMQSPYGNNETLLSKETIPGKKKDGILRDDCNQKGTSQDDFDTILQLSGMRKVDSGGGDGGGARRAVGDQGTNQQQSMLKSINYSSSNRLVSNSNAEIARVSLSAGATPLSSSLSYQQKDYVIKRSKECLRHAPVKLQIAQQKALDLLSSMPDGKTSKKMKSLKDEKFKKNR